MPGARLYPAPCHTAALQPRTTENAAVTPGPRRSPRDRSRHLLPAVVTSPTGRLSPPSQPASHGQAPSGASCVTRLTGPPAGSAHRPPMPGVCNAGTQKHSGGPAPSPHQRARGSRSEMGLGCPRNLGKQWWSRVLSRGQEWSGSKHRHAPCTQHGPWQRVQSLSGPPPHPSTPTPPLAPGSCDTGCFGGSDHQKRSQEKGLASEPPLPISRKAGRTQASR